jgi:hypothetical protein
MTTRDSSPGVVRRGDPVSIALACYTFFLLGLHVADDEWGKALVAGVVGAAMAVDAATDMFRRVGRRLGLWYLRRTEQSDEIAADD